MHALNLDSVKRIYDSLAAKLVTAIVVIIIFSNIYILYVYYKTEKQNIFSNNDNISRVIIKLAMSYLSVEYNNFVDGDIKTVAEVRSELATFGQTILDEINLIDSIKVENGDSEKSINTYILMWLSQKSGRISLYVYDSNLKGVVHPNRSKIGMNWKDYAGLKGRDILSEAASDLVNRKQMYSVVYWDDARGNTGKYLTYFTRYAKKNWIIATAIRIEDIEAESAMRKKMLIDKLRTTFADIPRERSAKIFVLDGNWNMLVHPELEGKNLLNINDRNLNAEKLREMAQDIREGNIPIRYMMSRPSGKDQERLAYGVYFKPLDWYICYCVGIDDLYSGVGRLALVGASAIIPIFIISSMMAYFLVLSLTRPLKVLTEYVSALPSDDFNMRKESLEKLENIASGRNDEAGSLAKSFIELHKRLDRHLLELKRTHWERENYLAELMRINSELDVMVLDRTEELDTTNAKLVKKVEKLKKTKLELINARNMAEDANKAKSLFLANMSHEIRTPLNAVIGMTEMALQSSTDSVIREYMETSMTSAKHLLMVINNILDLSKIEAGKLELESEDFNLKTLVGDVIRTFSFQCTSRLNNLNMHIDDDVPVFLRTDTARLKQVLINLIGNAVKFTENGDIFVSVSLAGEERDGSQPGTGVDELTGLMFCVRDTGIGIPSDVRDSIFEMFNQADVSITRKFGGTGLGLAICKKIVEMMGGEIRVESELGKGSSFCFTIFVQRALSEVREEAVQPGLAVVPLRDLQILLVEDNAPNIKVALSFLNSMGHSVDVATDGFECLIKLSRKKYDLIFMDVQMPKMDGFETTRRIRNGESGQLNVDTRIIAMTAHALSEYRDKAMQSGMDGYITKPLNYAQLSETLSTGTSHDRPVFSAGDEPPEKRSIDDLEVMDEEKAMLRLMKDRQLFEHLCTEYVIEMESIGRRISDALESADFDEAARLAHSSKAVAAMICAERLAELLNEVEKAAFEKNKAAVSLLLERLREEIPPFVEFVKKLAPGNGKKT